MQTPEKGQVFQVPSTIVAFRAVAADTGGAFSLFEGRVAPGQGNPLHYHEDDEAFLVLEGAFEFQIGNQRLYCGPGDFAFVPKRTPHRYLNTSRANEGRLLVITLPGGPHERFFAEIGTAETNLSAPFSAEPPDIHKLVTIGKRFGFELLPGA